MNSVKEDEQSWKNRETEKIIADIRTEVAVQKACITQYTFQAIGLVGVVWGFIFKFYSEKNPIALYLCGSVLVFLTLAVVRMANHKYLTVNRNLGYELHLNRLKDYSQIGSPSWRDKMLEVGWEEAMCAWRVSQATIFENIYEKTNFMQQHRRKKEHLRNIEYCWYDTRSLLKKKGGAYHPGNYLRNVHWMLHAMGGFSIAVMLYLYSLQLATSINNHTQLPLSEKFNLVAIAVLMFAITIYFLAQINRQGSFRRILESEILSIQATAVVWRVVITCHILAVMCALRWHKSYQFYTQYCARLAVNFNLKPYEPHDWLAKMESMGLSGGDNSFHELKQVLMVTPHNDKNLNVKSRPAGLITSFAAKIRSRVFSRQKPEQAISPTTPQEQQASEKPTDAGRG